MNSKQKTYLLNQINLLNEEKEVIGQEQKSLDARLIEINTTIDEIKEGLDELPKEK